MVSFSDFCLCVFFFVKADEAKLTYVLNLEKRTDLKQKYPLTSSQLLPDRMQIFQSAVKLKVK